MTRTSHLTVRRGLATLAKKLAMKEIFLRNGNKWNLTKSWWIKCVKVCQQPHIMLWSCRNLLILWIIFLDFSMLQFICLQLAYHSLGNHINNKARRIGNLCRLKKNCFEGEDDTWFCIWGYPHDPGVLLVTLVSNLSSKTVFQFPMLKLWKNDKCQSVTLKYSF